MTAFYAWPRWGGSLLAVVGFHAAALSVVLYLTPTEPPTKLNEPPALMLELAPLPKPIATPQATPAPPVATTPPPPAPVVAAVRPLEKPQPPRPTPPKPTPPKPQPKPEPVQPLAQAPRPVESAPTPPATPVARTTPAPSPAPAEVASPTEMQAAQNWQGRLLQHIARYKRYPHHARRQGEEGVVRIRVRIDGNGNILAQNVTAHCTDSLDQAAQQTLQQAQPLPAPPTHLLNNGSVEFVLPFQYSLAER